MRTLVGTAAIIRLIARRDRIRLALWIALLAAVTIATAASFARLFSSPASRLVFGAGVTNNPALRALIGPMFDATTVGGLTAWRLGALGSVLVGLMSLLTVVRHTRADEEAGRLELLGASAIGRHAVLAAAILVALGANALLAIAVCGGLIAVGLPIAGAAALGLSFAMTGAIFAAIAAVAAQLAVTARAARGLAGALLGLAYLSRAAGDAGGVTALSWASPIGWAQRTRPFAGERWPIFALGAAVTCTLAACAFALSSRRDLGAGILPPRRGPATASPRLRSPFALAWRLQRGALLGWTSAFLVIGTALGSVAGGVTDLLASNPRLQAIVAMIGGHPDLVAAYFAATTSVLGVVASAYAIQAVLRLRSEEEATRAELVLTARVGRLRWATGHLVLAAIGPAILLAAAGTAAGLVHGLRIGDVGHALPPVLGAALVQLPAIWVMASIAVAGFGLAPRWTSASWGALVAFLLVGELGQLLQLDHRIVALSPFTHLPKLPGGHVAIAPLLELVAVTTLLTAAGLVGFRRRDVGA